jgi:hypothetical protein
MRQDVPMGQKRRRRRKQTPLQRLREHVGMGVSEFARETGLTRPTVYNLQKPGARCSSTTDRKLRARWGPQIRYLGLRGSDFIDGVMQDEPRG